MTALAEFAQSRELLINLTMRELKGKYKRSLLGWTWSLLNPISLTVIYTIVFGSFLVQRPPVGQPSGVDNFAAWLMCGLLPWTFVANSLTGSMSSLVANAGLIKKVYFPRELLAFSTVFALLVSFAIEMVVLLLFLTVLGGPGIAPWILPAILVVAAITSYAAGLGLLFSVLNVYFRDVQYLIGILMNLWFYMTPIVYRISYVEDFAALHPRFPIMTMYKLNPMVSFVEVFRDLLYNRRWPQMTSVAYITAWGVGMLLVGLWVFRRYEGRLAEEL